MSKMDDVPQYELDLYVEDPHAQAMLTEILAAHEPDLVSRCRLIPFGAASVGRALGEMVAGNKFPTPSCVFLDGDQGAAVGCFNLPGEDPPEHVVFSALASQNWLGLSTRIGRSYPDTVDACNRAMTLGDHHEWVRAAATQLVVSGDLLWQAMCAEWATKILAPEQATVITQAVMDALNAAQPTVPQIKPVPAPPAQTETVNPPQAPSESNVPAQLVLQSPGDAQE
jgi:hypothetical protein